MGALVSGLVGGGLSLLGGALQGNAARDAANTSAAAQRDAARTAADAARFRPVGVTSNFGTSNFQFDPNGYLTGAGYTLDPRLQAVQGGLLGGLPQSQQDVANIQNMGRQYMAQSPQEQAQQYIAQQQALLQPSRDRQMAALGTQNYNQGTTGLSVAQGGTMAAANPYASALANAQALQDLQLAAQATQAGQQQYTFGQGLLSSAYSPLQSQLGTAATLEQLGQSPLDIGAQLGGRSATAGANVGNTLLQGGLAAARTTQAGNAYSPFGSAVSGLASNQAFGSGVGNYLNAYGNSLQANRQYGAENVYGYGGGGMQPSESVWGSMFSVDGGI
jgi:hypothetical protein